MTPEKRRLGEPGTVDRLVGAYVNGWIAGLVLCVLLVTAPIWLPCLAVWGAWKGLAKLFGKGAAGLILLAIAVALVIIIAASASGGSGKPRDGGPACYFVAAKDWSWISERMTLHDARHFAGTRRVPVTIRESC